MKKIDMSRIQKARRNTLFSLLQQGVAFVCGLIVPKLMLNAFGSEAYGATSSIATFLAYITLLEGGIGAVTRSALYRAFAEKSDEQISAIVTETKDFYRKIAYAFIIYVIILACFFKQISHNSVFGYWYSFSLVIVIALSSFAEYSIGISYTLLLQADQMNYVVLIFKIITSILNTIIIVVLISLKSDILTVKLASGIVFVLKPVLLSFYVRRRYRLRKVHLPKKTLENKKTAIGQHIAWMLHNNTDITVLTIFRDLATVSVYSVYNMIVAQIQSIQNAFLSGMEAVFGSMYANKENENLKKTFGYYETLISLIGVTLFSITAILIVPFIKIYTSGLTDAKYDDPVFAIMLIIASMIYTFGLPYHQMIIAAGRFKETRMASYGEAIINISVSVLLVIRFGIVGVAVGTVAATLFRTVYYVVYLSKHILKRNAFLWIRRMITNIIVFTGVYIIGKTVLSLQSVSNYLEWIISAVIITLISGAISLFVNFIVYKGDVLAIVQKIMKSTHF